MSNVWLTVKICCVKKGAGKWGRHQKVKCVEVNEKKMSLLVRYVTHHRANLHSRSAQCLAYFPEKNTKEEEEEEEEEKEQNEMIENGERGRASERARGCVAQRCIQNCYT